MKGAPPRALAGRTDDRTGEDCVTHIVFDIGNVLIAWDKRAPFRDAFADDAAIDAFLAEIDFHAWNLLPGLMLITFDPYRVGPWAAGEQAVAIPLDSLRALLDPDLPLEMSSHSVMEE